MRSPFDAVCPRIAGLAALMALAAVDGPARAGVAQVSHENTLNANFVQTRSGPDGTTQVLITASQGKTQSPPGPPAFGPSLFISYGRIAPSGNVFAFGTIPLDAGDFVIDKKLGFASLKATFELNDVFSQEILTFEVDLEWVATEPPVFDASHDHVVFQEFAIIFNTRLKSASSAAAASGSISVDGEVVATGPPDFSFLYAIKAGNVIILLP